MQLQYLPDYYYPHQFNQFNQFNHYYSPSMNNVAPQCPTKRGVKRKMEFEDRPSKRFLSEKLLQLKLSDEQQNQYVNCNITDVNNTNNAMEMEKVPQFNEPVKKTETSLFISPDKLNIDQILIQTLEKKDEPIVPRTLLPAEYNQRAIVLYVSPTTIIEEALKSQSLEKEDEMEE